MGKMEMHDRNAEFIVFEDRSNLFVGEDFQPRYDWPSVTVTKIRITRDLPGLHCDMWRACVYAGETLIFEAPLHNLAGVGYAAPNDRLKENDEKTETN